MSDIVCVTSRSLCRGDFLDQLSKIAKAGPKYVILREKDLIEEKYGELAENAAAVFHDTDTRLILHYYYRTAIEMGWKSVHLPLHILRELTADKKSRFEHIGASCHSVEDAQEAESLGADYITAGHVFATDCHRAELNFSAVCVKVSVYLFMLSEEYRPITLILSDSVVPQAPA